MARERFPRSVYQAGDDPDPRFTLANERTFLAWIRTSLALLAGGIALEVLGLGIHEDFRVAASVVLMVTGIVAAPFAWWGWARYERALRNNAPLPSSRFALPVASAVTLSGILVFVGFLVR
ncbi:YidH family protein [Tessaracoccus sp. G1721]